MSDLLEYKGFFGSVGYSAEDECLVGEVLFIDGTIVYAGDSASEIKQMFEEAVDGYLEMCAEREIEAQKPFKGSFNVRVDPAVHKQAAIEAKRAGVSLNAFVGEAILEKLNPRQLHHHTHIHEAETLAPDVSSFFESVMRKPDAVREVRTEETTLCH